MAIRVSGHCTYDGKEYQEGDSVTGKVAKALLEADMAVDDKQKEEKEAE